jgi:hypothetical protein
MPEITWPKGANPWSSSPALLPKLMNTCVVRVSGPAVAKVIVPRLLLALTGSSLMLASRQTCEICGLPLMPNWTMKPEMTRKKRASL